MKRIGLFEEVKSTENLLNKAITRLADEPEKGYTRVFNYDSDSDKLTPRKREIFEKFMG